jgi:hypothetical protein
MDSTFAEWAKEMGVPVPVYSIMDHDDLFYSNDDRIMISVKFVRAFDDKEAASLKLMYFLAHEFCHYVAKINKTSFSFEEEERYANKTAEKISGILLEDAIVSLHKLVPILWNKIAGGISLKEGLKRIKDAKAKGDYLAENYFADILGPLINPYTDEQIKILRSLRPYIIFQRHEDNSVTIQTKDKYIRVAPDGKQYPANTRPNQRLILFPKTKHDPFKFAEAVLGDNLFEESDLHIYSGQSGTNPLGVDDAIWEHVFLNMGGKFVKMGDLYTVAGGPPDLPIGLRPDTRPIYVFITDGGGTSLTEYSLVTKEEFEKENTLALKKGYKPAKGQESRSYQEMGGSFKSPEELENLSKVIEESEEIRDKESILEDLTKSEREEIQANLTYQNRADMAEEHGDKETANLFREVAMDEEEHTQEFEKRIRELGGFKNGLEFLPDSPEFLAETISSAGWREQLDQAFQAAIAKVRSK